MILLAIASFVLFFVTYALGLMMINLLGKLFNTAIEADFLGVFFLGLISSFVYFSCISFVAPVNYLALIPIFIGSLFFFLKDKKFVVFAEKLKALIILLFSKNNIWITLPVLILLFIYWIIPPGNADSGAYHYFSIRWYEKYKLVPGLANIHGRLSFNPASFIISAPYSFTDIAEQSLYPLNGVLALLFYCWILQRVAFYKSYVYSCILLVVSMVFLRVVLINISSPSSDLLANLLVFYIGLKCYELIKTNKVGPGHWLPLILMVIFSITSKLSIAFIYILIPFLLFFIKKNRIQFVLKLFLPGLLIIIPWLVRNIIMSGYALYPIPDTNFWNVDWEVPKEVLKLDYLYGKVTSQGVRAYIANRQHAPFLLGIKNWFSYALLHQRFEAIIFLFAMLSPLYWFVAFLAKKRDLRILWLWLIIYGCVLIWLISAPEFRFATAYFMLLFCLPLFELTSGWNGLPLKTLTLLNTGIIYLTVIWYSISIVKKPSTYYFTLSDCWLYPLKDKSYSETERSSFPFRILNNGVKLFIADSTHACLNADLPCMPWPYGDVEMRGNKIENGFRNIKNEVKRNYPFLE